MIWRMADGESQGADLVKAVGQAVGLLAGAVALVYMVGGAVLALRLYIEDLPSRTIVAQLSRDLLVSVGLAQVVLPGIAIAADPTAAGDKISAHVAARRLHRSGSSISGSSPHGVAGSSSLRPARSRPWRSRRTSPFVCPGCCASGISPGCYQSRCSSRC